MTGLAMRVASENWSTSNSSSSSRTSQQSEKNSLKRSWASMMY